MHKRRALILTDISTLDALSGEPDDTQSLLRLLLYSDQIDILGLIATYTEHLNCAAPHLLREALGWYRAAYQNLRGAVPFMAPEALEEVIFQGSDAPGVEQIKAAPSPGAARIARCALSAEEPLYVLCWGGVTDLAQALSLLEAEQPPAVFSRCLSRLRVYAIADQYDACGPHIRRAYPQLFYITAYDSFRGMYRGGPRETCAPAWLRTHIAQGPYGRHYPIYDGGDAFSGVLGPVRGLKEGDSPSFLYLVQNGLSDPERPEQGGWGGRFLKQPGA